MGKDLITLQGTFRIDEVVKQNFGDIWRFNPRVREDDPTLRNSGVRYFGPNTFSLWDRQARPGNPINNLIVMGHQRDGSGFTSDWKTATYIAVRLHDTVNGDVGTAYFQMSGATANVGTDAQGNILQSVHPIRERSPDAVFNLIIQRIWRGEQGPDQNFRRPGRRRTDLNVAWCIVNEGTLYANQPWDLTQERPNTSALEPMTAWAKVIFVR